jgi:hypothetical protein
VSVDLRIDHAEALFVSNLSQSCAPEAAEVTAAIARTRDRYGGSRGCAAAMAAEFGDHPETAAARMRWALEVVSRVYPVAPPWAS